MTRGVVEVVDVEEEIWCGGGVRREDKGKRGAEEHQPHEGQRGAERKEMDRKNMVLRRKEEGPHTSFFLPWRACGHISSPPFASTFCCSSSTTRFQ